MWTAAYMLPTFLAPLLAVELSTAVAKDATTEWHELYICYPLCDTPNVFINPRL